LQLWKSISLTDLASNNGIGVDLATFIHFDHLVRLRIPRYAAAASSAVNRYHDTDVRRGQPPRMEDHADRQAQG
jgi:hypothetical protein